MRDVAIHQSGTFDYEAEFTEDSFGEGEVLLQGADSGGGVEERLVGPRPRLRLWRDGLVIFTSEKRRAGVRHASFAVGDAANLTARPGDRLHLSRTNTGGVGLSLLRGRRLVFALGAVTSVPLGDDVRVVAGRETAGKILGMTPGWSSRSGVSA